MYIIYHDGICLSKEMSERYNWHESHTGHNRWNWIVWIALSGSFKRLPEIWCENMVVENPPKVLIIGAGIIGSYQDKVLSALLQILTFQLEVDLVWLATKLEFGISLLWPVLQECPQRWSCRGSARECWWPSSLMRSAPAPPGTAPPACSASSSWETRLLTNRFRHIYIRHVSSLDKRTLWDTPLVCRGKQVGKIINSNHVSSHEVCRYFEIWT